MSEVFVDSNRLNESTTTHLSPDGRYRLLVTNYLTKPGCWEYTQGLVYRDDRQVAVIHRNHPTFPYAFICDHPDGHDYLIAGENYQGRTVIQLDTSRRVDVLLEDSPFCQQEILPSPGGDRLAVLGCYWGGPQIVYLLNFSSPLDPSSWTVLHRSDDCDVNHVKWKGDYLLTYEVEDEVVKKFDKQEYLLSSGEKSELVEMMKSASLTESDIYEQRVLTKSISLQTV